MSGLIELFDDFSLRINVQIDQKKNSKDLPDEAPKISTISWNIQEIDDDCDFFQVPEEKLNLIAYRQSSITFMDIITNYKKTFSAAKNNPTFFTLKDIISRIIEFEKEARQLTDRRTSSGEIDTYNNVFQGLRRFETNDDQQIFTLSWSN